MSKGWYRIWLITETLMLIMAGVSLIFELWHVSTLSMVWAIYAKLNAKEAEE